MVAQVLVELKLKHMDHTFDYKIPLELEKMVQVGKRVLVPFGKQTLEGFVLGINENSDYDKLKNILKVIDDEVILNEELISIGNYISKKTLATKISSYQSMLPRALKANKDFSMNKKLVTYVKLIDKNYQAKNDKQKKLIDVLSKKDVLKTELKDYISSINTLKKNNIIEEYSKEIYRLNEHEEKQEYKVILNADQEKAIKRVFESKNEFKPFLLYGVTGSGKTEVYMNMIKNVIDDNKSAIVLVPEISLTPQLVGNFRRRFGNLIAVLHSGLSEGEKYDEWRKIVRKEVSIVIGARSAIFAPLTNLGIIIIDEEHTSTYKQDSNPRYHAIDVALYRGKYNNIPVVLGSATPSLESYTRASVGAYELLKLPKRINNNLPSVKLIDMSNEIKKGYKIISKELLENLNEVLCKKEQAIILLNRRGYSTTVSCHACGYKVMCPNCDIPLTYHKKSNTMKCHYCDYTTYKPEICPECKSHNINQFGMGTEKLEEEIKKLIPNSRVVRMDIDTTSIKGSHKKIFESFKRHEYDILVGTQMISKGLDFENVTLVGVINGDASLNIPDFRSSERTFSLLNQVAGRAGRGDKKGKVIIQGFNLTHYSIIKASVHDYLGFYEEEMKVRKILKYPPYYNLSIITISGKNQENTLNESNKIATYLRNNTNGAIVLGPSSSIMPKINNNFYFQITIKYKKSANLINNLKFINEKYSTDNNIRIAIDLNAI